MSDLDWCNAERFLFLVFDLVFIMMNWVYSVGKKYDMQFAELRNRFTEVGGHNFQKARLI